MAARLWRTAQFANASPIGYVESKGLELVGARMVTALAQGGTPGPEASIRKVVAASKTQSVASFGIDLQEMAGILVEEGADDGLYQDAFLHAPGSRIAGGSDEILRNIIAERVLHSRLRPARTPGRRPSCFP